MGKRRGPATPIVVPRKPSPFVSSSSAGFELQKEVERLKEQLTDKQETIEAQAKYIEKLTLSLEQKSAQNEEIIQHYYRQYKELEQSRQELKLLQHEYTQMSSVYRIGKTELQTKLQEATERISQLLEEKENYNTNNDSNHNNKTTNNDNSKNNARRKPPSTQVKRSKRRKSRRASADLSSCSTKIIVEQQDDDASTSRRDEPFRPILEEACTCNPQAAPAPADPSGSSVQRQSSQSGRPQRRAAGAVASYKEPPLNTKMRRP